MRVPKAVFALIFLIGAGGQAPSGPTLSWTEHPKLTWADFKGQPQASAFPSALSDTGFNYRLACKNGMLDVDAAAFFSPEGSWVKLKKKTDELLKHEQGHFDMAEWYALRLRKAILDAKISCADKTKANAAGLAMVTEYQKGWADAEREYEQDTKDGSDCEKQDAASRKIAADLAAVSSRRQ